MTTWNATTIAAGDYSALPTLPGVLVGQEYGFSEPFGPPPPGCVWVPIQRDDEAATFPHDYAAASAYASAVGSPVGPSDGVPSGEGLPEDTFVAVPIGATIEPAPVIAKRVTMHEAKRHFEAGGAVLVSEYGHEPTQTVRPDSTTHDRTRTTWDALAADVREWRNRYPNQRFYIVPTVDACTCSTDEDACPDHPGDPCPACGRRSGHDDECAIVARLEYLRGELRGECISMGELHELQTLAPFIDPGDVELLEPAGVPEFPDDIPDETRAAFAALTEVVRPGGVLALAVAALEDGDYTETAGKLAAAYEAAQIKREDMARDLPGLLAPIR